MTWKDLLNNGDIQAHTTSRNEIESLRKVIDRDLKDSRVEAISEDRRFATAYNGALQSAQMAIAAAGYRVRKGKNVHYQSFEALRTAIPNREIEDLCDYFDTCRRKRHDIDYDIADVVTATEVNEIIDKTDQLRRAVEDWIASDHPKFKA